jgi:hypothetical protein
MARIVLLLGLLACKTEDMDTYPGCGDEDLLILYQDADSDGFGSTYFPLRSCTYVDGYVYNAEDCDDSNAASYPGAVELCDDLDNDCDGLGDSVQSYYPDADGDGYGVPGATVDDCTPPDGYAATDDDCDDTSPFVNPDAVDNCDGIDNDCDGDVDEDAKSGWPLMSIDHRAEAVWSVNRNSGALSLVSGLSVENEEIPTMDTRGDGYALVYDSNDKMLLEIDACTGTMTPVGGESGVGRTCGIAFGPGGALYGLDNSENTLVIFDTQTGAGTAIGELGFDLAGCGLTYNCSTDALIGANSMTGELFEIDTSTGLPSNVVQTDIPFNSVGLEFDAPTGLILASTNESYYELDPSTGISTKLADFASGTHMNDLAFHPACP